MMANVQEGLSGTASDQGGSRKSHKVSSRRQQSDADVTLHAQLVLAFVRVVRYVLLGAVKCNTLLLIHQQMPKIVGRFHF